MVKSYKSKPGKIGNSGPSDRALLDVIQGNVQRVAQNDNRGRERQYGGEAGLLGSVTSALAFAGILVIGMLVMALMKLVPSSEDSHY